MSHAGLILGLPELEVERVDRNDAIAVYARPKKRPCCLHCHTREFASRRPISARSSTRARAIS
jgi:hypothetical protein